MKNSLRILLTLLIIIIVGISIYFWRFSNNNMMSGQMITPLHVADWTTYTDNQFGLSFQYPPATNVLPQIIDPWLGGREPVPQVIVNFNFINKYPNWTAKTLTIIEHDNAQNCDSWKLNASSTQIQVIGGINLNYDYTYRNQSNPPWTGVLKQYYYPVNNKCFLLREELIAALSNIPISPSLNSFFEPELSDIDKVLNTIQTTK